MYLEEIDANSLSSSYGSEKSIGQDGETTTGVTYEPRTIILSCAFNGKKDGRMSHKAAQEMAQKIYRVFVLKEEGVLTYKNNVGTYMIRCRPTELPEMSKVIGAAKRFDIMLIADNPLWLSSAEFKNRLGSVEGGKRYPLRYPLRFGTWIKIATINNETYVDTPITVEIGSTAKYIILKNNTTGEFLHIEKPVEENQKMIIWTGNDPYVAVITYDEYGNEIKREYANYRLTLDSRYFKLVPGINELELDNGFPGTMPIATVKYYKQYQGV